MRPRSGVHQFGGQPLDRSETALDHLAEADLLGMVNSLLEFSRWKASLLLTRALPELEARRVLGEASPREYAARSQNRHPSHVKAGIRSPVLRILGE